MPPSLNDYLSPTLRTITAALLAMLLSAETLNAHFIWVYVDSGTPKIVFGEGPEPGEAEFLQRLDKLKAWNVANQQVHALKFQQQTEGSLGWLELTAPPTATAINASCLYGIFSRGEATMLLHYDAKYLRLASDAPVASQQAVGNDQNRTDADASPSEKLRLDLIPSMDHGTLRLTATFDGRPASGVEITTNVTQHGATAVTDQTGVAPIRLTTRYVIRAKHTVDQAGEHRGQRYSTQRYYCTLVLDVANLEAQTDSIASPPGPTKLSLKRIDSTIESIPAGLTSFGASRIGPRIYIVGGKSGKAHDYAREYQNRDVLCFDLNNPKAGWKSVADNLGLQGLALVATDSQLIRMGGLEARNQPGEDHDLHSVDQVLAFDVANRQWSTLPALPEGRSSFDACRIGSQLFLVGGWSMAGTSDPVWSTNLLTIDLDADKPTWTATAAPFEKRALAVGAFQGQVIVVGGIDSSGSPANSVHLFDPETSSWRRGPDVPTEGNMLAFGCAVVGVGDCFLASTYDGSIFQLAPDMKEWRLIHQLDRGRFFHQLVALNDNQFAIIGGANMESGGCREVEVYELAR